jgi:hypothetical protein
MSLWTPNQRTLTKTDHDNLVALGKGVNSVIEFGPGYSTFAWIEAGVDEIVGLEHDPVWFAKQTERFKDYPQVKIDHYWNTAPAAKVPDWVAERQFDIAFVDSPKGYMGARVAHPGQEDCSRLNTCLAALQLAPVVYLHDAARPLERATMMRLQRDGHSVRFVAYGPPMRHGKDVSYGIARIKRDGQNKSGTRLPNIAEFRRPPDGGGPV